MNSTPQPPEKDVRPPQGQSAPAREVHAVVTPIIGEPTRFEEVAEEVSRRYAMISAGLAVSGTWPLRTELGNRILGLGSNVLASSVVLVCRQRCEDSAIATRRDFIASLKAELPVALAHLQRGNIAPVDLAQAAIGPGMAVYTRYATFVAIVFWMARVRFTPRTYPSAHASG